MNKFVPVKFGEIRSMDDKNGSTQPIVVNNHSIVASRGELTRDHFYESPRKKKTYFSDGKIPSAGDTKRQPPVQGRGSRDPKSTIQKSVSVPANLRGLSGREKPPASQHSQEEIIKRFFPGPTGPIGLTSGKPTPNRNHQVSAVATLPPLRSAKAQSTSGFREAEDETRLSSALKRLSFTNRKISFGNKILPKNCSKPTDSVKKSVSFSSDTGFEEKKNFRRTAIHEAKLYRKGVLQEPSVSEEVGKIVPTLWVAPPGGPQALLRAAREADDQVLRKIITRIGKFGMDDTDINFKDSTGRTATSYIAGNGSADILEAILELNGIDPNIPDNEGNTPLHFAAQAGQTDCLNILLQECIGIEVNTRNNFGFTPLMKAALQGRTKCAKILLFAGANPTLRDHGRGLRANEWARFCGRNVCAEIIERFARHRLLENPSTSCRWGSEPELAAKVLQGKVVIPTHPPLMGLRSRLKRVFRTTSGPDRTFSLVNQLTSAALCASSAALPKPGNDVPPAVKSLLRPLSVPQLRITLVGSSSEEEDIRSDKCVTNFSEKIESTIAKKKSK